MKNNALKFLGLGLILLSMACTGTNMTSNQNGKEEVIWLNSDFGEDLVIHDEVGVRGFQCYEAYFNETLTRGAMNLPDVEWSPLCGSIEGFDNYEEGNFYQLKVVKTKNDKKNPALSEYRLVEVLNQEQDRSYERMEKKKVRINSRVVEGPCSGFAPPDCLEKRHMSVPFKDSFENSASAKWKINYDLYYREELEEGYLYIVEYTKKYNPPMIQIADAPNFQIIDFKVVEKTKDPNYGEVEKVKLWIGPQKVEVACRGFAPVGCKEERYQAQRGETVDENGKWEALYDIYPNSELKEGYIYQVEYKKVYNPPHMQIADGPNFQVKDFKVLSEIKAKK